MSSALKIAKESPEANSPKGKTTREKVENTLTSELIIAICYPIGSLKDNVVDCIEEILQNRFGYEVERIKISNYIKKNQTSPPPKKMGETPAYTELKNKIIGGTELRKNYHFSCLVELAIHDIVYKRLAPNGELIKKIEDLESRRKCYIIDSLKNKEELHLLRSVYNNSFYCFSIFSPKDERIDNLTKKDLSSSEVKDIIDADEFENNESGQNVRETFVEGDFFVRVSKENLKDLKIKIERYLHLMFESKIITPYPNEIAMYEATSASGNSACLSRQVGAAITNEKGEIISRGWNDVPKFGGNLYNDGDPQDFRCMIHNKYCSNDVKKDELSEEIIKGILETKEIKEIIESKKEDLEKAIFINSLKKIVRKSAKVKNLIEFSRSVHAEMHAIIIGSQLAGNKMVGGKLFCTTYPCHNCARHIIVAGIKEIYYIEPYVKSLCLTLHSDAITENENASDKVKILMYDGVAPRRFLDLFTMKRARKGDDGKVILPDEKKVNPKTRISIQALPTLEIQALHSLNEKGLIDISQFSNFVKS